MLRRFGALATIGLGMLGGASLFATQGQAAFIATIEQVGPNVVVTGSGSLDVTGLSFEGAGADVSGIFPAVAAIGIGSPNSDPADEYGGLISGPSNFGSGGETIPSSSGGGDKVALIGSGNELDVPQGYVSGNPLADSSTYNGATLASLGVIPGTYIWTWGSGADADSFTIDAGVVVPEPASLMLLGIAMALTLLAAGRRRKA